MPFRAPTAARRTAALALLVATLSGVARAQESPGPTQQPLARTARVDLDGNVLFAPDFTWSMGGLYAPFITERWQVGAGLWYTGYTGPVGGAIHGIQVVALANYHLRGGDHRFRPYVGGYADAAGATDTPGATWYGAQVGGNYMLSPYVALRTELSYRVRFGAQLGYWDRADLVITLDPYVRGRVAPAALTAASLGAFDIAFTAQARLRPDPMVRAGATLAPFLTRWLQLGGELDYVRYSVSHVMSSASARTLTGFVRLYAPADAPAVPFVGAALESSTSLSAPGERSSVRVLGGIRHQLGPGAALDVMLNWQRYAQQGTGLARFRPPNEVGLRARVVTLVRRGR
jgi:hypothetical protein